MGMRTAHSGLAARGEAGVSEESTHQPRPGIVGVKCLIVPAPKILTERREVVLLDLAPHPLGEDGALGVDDARAYPAHDGSLAAMVGGQARAGFVEFERDDSPRLCS